MAVSLKPLFRKPFLFVIAVAGVAISVALFFAMSVSSDKALQALASGNNLLIAAPERSDLPTLQWEKLSGRHEERDLDHCLALAPRGLECVASVSLYRATDDGQLVRLVALRGPAQVIVTPIVSDDLKDKTLAFDGRNLRPASRSAKIREAVILSYEQLRVLVGRDLGFDTIHARPLLSFNGDREDWMRLGAELSARFASDNSVRFSLDRDNQDDQLQLTSSYRLNLMVLAATSILVAGLFLWNIAALQMQAQREVVSVLRLQGMTRLQVLKLVFLEQGMIGLTGGWLGVAVGLWLERSVSKLTLSTLSERYVPVHSVPSVNFWEHAWYAVIFGVLFYWVASLQILGQALRIQPNQLRRREQVLRTRPAMTLVLVVVSSLLYLGARHFPNFEISLLTEKPQPYGAYLGAFGLFVLGFALAQPCSKLWGVSLKTWMAKLSSTRIPLARVAITKFAATSLRNRSGVATVSAALTLALGISLMVNSFRSSVTEWFDEVFQAQIVVAGRVMTANSKAPLVPDAFISELRGLSNVTGVECLATSNGFLGNKKVQVFGVRYDTPTAYATPLSFMHEKVELRTVGDFNRVMQKSELVVISETLSNQLGVGIGDFVPLTIGGDEKRTFQIAAVVRDYGSERGYVLLSRQNSSALQSVGGCQSLRIYDRGDTAEAIQEIGRLDPNQSVLALQSTSQLRRMVIDTFDQTFAVTGVMTLMSVFLGGLALLVHIAQSTTERKDEWLILRRLGCSWWDLWLIALADSLFVLIAGAVLGTLGGWLLAFLLVFVINVRSFGWSFAMPWSQIFKTTLLMVPMFMAMLAVLSAVITASLIRPGEKWRSARE